MNIRESFNRDLQALEDDILEVGSLVQENLVKVTAALAQRDFEQSRKLVKDDKWVNKQRITIGMEAFSLIARQQPMAGDMRLIAAVLEIIGELERIHDYVKGIGNINIMIGEDEIPANLMELLPQMAELAQAMLRDALEAFTARDGQLALRVAKRDDAVDKLYNKTYKRVMRYMNDNPSEASYEMAHRVEWAAHNLERSADRVTNICEWIVYLVTGHYKEVQHETYGKG
jgi:phosphate transport system protein